MCVPVEVVRIPCQGIFQYRLSIGCPGVDREVRSDAEMHAMHTQNARAKAIECVDVGAFFHPGRQGGHPAFHLVGGLVRESQRQDAEALVR